MSRSNIIQVAIGVFTLVGIILGGLKYIATKSDLAEAMEYIQNVDKRLEQKINTDAIRDLNQRLWDLQDKHHFEGEVEDWKDEEDKSQYRYIKLELEVLQKEYKENLKNNDLHR